MIIRVLMENSTACDQLACEHGLSLHIEQGGMSLLFDAGQSDAFAANAAKMGVDLSAVDFAVLSHGHYDHSGGLARFLQLNDHAPVYVHHRAFEPHFNASNQYIGVDPSLQGHPRIVTTQDEHALPGGAQLCTCNALVRGCPASARGMSVDVGGTRIQDSFAHEQYLILEEHGRRVVISGCSHKGILDIVRWLRPDVLIGGFHFMKLDPQGGDAPLLRAAAKELLASGCTFYTGHCTGEAPFAFLKDIMGDRLHAIHTGTTIEI